MYLLVCYFRLSSWDRFFTETIVHEGDGPPHVTHVHSVSTHSIETAAANFAETRHVPAPPARSAPAFCRQRRRRSPALPERTRAHPISDQIRHSLHRQAICRTHGCQQVRRD